jgi:hypothetical protein
VSPCLGTRAIPPIRPFLYCAMGDMNRLPARGFSLPSCGRQLHSHVFAELRSDVSDRGSTTTSAVALYGCCEELGLELELLDMAVVASSCRGRLTLMLGRCSSSPPPPSTTLALSCPSLLLSVVCSWSGRAQHRIRHRSSAVNMAAVDVGAFACSQDRFDVLCCSS